MPVIFFCNTFGSERNLRDFSRQMPFFADYLSVKFKSLFGTRRLSSNNGCSFFGPSYWNEFTLEQLINCCYIEGIHEGEFGDFINQLLNHHLDIRQLLSEYKTQVEGILGSGGLDTVRYILGGGSKTVDFKGFKLGVADCGVVKDSEDPLEKDFWEPSTPDLEAIGKQAEHLIEISRQFKEFAEKHRCEENLQFLLDIYNYERVWNVCFAHERVSVLGCKIKHHNHNRTSNATKQSAGSNKVHLMAGELHPGLANIQGSFDVSSIVDLSKTTDPLDSEHTTQLAAHWDDRYKENNSGWRSNLSSCAASEASREDLIPENSTISKLKRYCKQEWQRIITKFIDKNGPSQLNLPQQVLDEILLEHHNTQIVHHSPHSLLGAKNTVVEILRENIYYPFTRQLGNFPAAPRKLSVELSFTKKRQSTFRFDFSSRTNTEASQTSTSSALSRIRGSFSTKKSSISSVFSRHSNSQYLSHAGFDSEHDQKLACKFIKDT